MESDPVTPQFLELVFVSFAADYNRLELESLCFA